jgi:hypothetical protein
LISGVTVKKNQRHKHRQPAHQAHQRTPVTEVVTKDNAPNANLGTDEQNREQQEPPDFDRGMLRWTRVVGAFTAVLAALGALQCWAFIQSERAFVAVMGIDQSFKLEANRAISARFLIKNAGRATAIINTGNITERVTVDPLPKTPPYATGDNTQLRVAGPITAGQERIATFVPKAPDGRSVQFAPDLISAIEGGNRRLYIFGFIKYEDEFSIFGHRTTGFCIVYVPKSEDRPDANFDVCGDENYAYTR